MSGQENAKPLGFGRLFMLARLPLAGAVISAVAAACLGIAPFWLIHGIVAELLAGRPDMAMVWRLALWVLVLLALRWGLMAASHMLAHAGAFAIQHRLRIAMARRLGEVPLSFLAGRGSGALRRTLTDDVDAMEGFFAHMLPDAVAAATVPVAALALLFLADWRLALASLAPLPVALAAQAWFMRRGTERAREWAALQQRIANRVGEYVRGVHVVKSFGLDAVRFGDLAASIRQAAGWVQSYVGQASSGWVLFVGLLTANMVLVAPLGAWLHMGGGLDTATLVLFLLVVPQVLAPLLRLTFSLGEQAQRAEALARIGVLLQAPSLAPVPDRALPQAPLDIRFDAVSQHYGDRRALDGVSLHAAAGRLTALVGPSGAGKSSLLGLVARLYEPTAGSVTVSGLDVRDWPLDALLSRIAIVFQDVFLFHGTVRENLLMARPDADEAQLQAATHAARIHEVIMALPQGYDTLLGERGAQLSGGERQRIAIARALLKDAPILLLDEATASVDAENEALIRDALDRLCQGRTVLMIAHRLGMVVQADNIVVLEGGRVAGQGRHGDLLLSCPLYRHLWQEHEQVLGWSLDPREGGRA